MAQKTMLLEGQLCKGQNPKNNFVEAPKNDVVLLLRFPQKHLSFSFQPGWHPRASMTVSMRRGHRCAPSCARMLVLRLFQPQSLAMQMRELYIARGTSSRRAMAEENLASKSARSSVDALISWPLERTSSARAGSFSGGFPPRWCSPTTPFLATFRGATGTWPGVVQHSRICSVQYS